MKSSSLLLGGLALALPVTSATATTYNGNTATGFGGNVGNGVLTITSNATAGTITFSEAPSGGNFGGNALVLYIDSQAGGFANTSTFTDVGDGEREAVSGYNPNPNNSNPAVSSRTTVTFPTGFAADYAIAFDAGNPGNINAFTLVGSGSYGFIANNQTTTSPYAITLSLASLGLPSANASFKFVGSFISETAYRSDETIGPASDGTGSLNGTDSTRNPGFSGPITFTGSNAFAVPEPASWVVTGLGCLALAGTWLRRRRESI